MLYVRTSAANPVTGMFFTLVAPQHTTTTTTTMMELPALCLAAFLLLPKCLAIFSSEYYDKPTNDDIAQGAEAFLWSAVLSAKLILLGLAYGSYKALQSPPGAAAASSSRSQRSVDRLLDVSQSHA